MSTAKTNYNLKHPSPVAAISEAEARNARRPWPRRLRIIAAALGIGIIAAGASWAIRAHWKANQKAAVRASIKDPRVMRRAVEEGKIGREDAWEAMQKAREEQENKRM